MAVKIPVMKFHRMEAGLQGHDGEGICGPLKSPGVPQHVPSLIHCLGWMKAFYALDTITACFIDTQTGHVMCQGRFQENSRGGKSVRLCV